MKDQWREGVKRGGGDGLGEIRYAIYTDLSGSRGTYKQNADSFKIGASLSIMPSAFYLPTQNKKHMAARKSQTGTKPTISKSVHYTKTRMIRIPQNLVTE